MQDTIRVQGARVNNLKNISVSIPRDKLVVLTGLSGSGKSSLAFDTIYAEGQRRYVESLSSYARMFLGQMDKPDVDAIDGLSPAISIDQKTTSKNPRSTVGTVTEIYDYLRLLWARVGTPHCPKCGKEIKQQTIDQIIDQIMALPEGTRIQVLAPVVRGRKGEHAKVLDDARRSGYVRVRADGNLYDLSEDIPLEKNKKHNIEIVVDRLIVRPDGAQRLTDSVETASHLSGGIVVVNLVREGQDLTFSQNYACDDCGISIEELTPRMFSFNNPFGACPTCTGLGMQLKADPAIILPDDSLSILDGAIVAPGWNSIRSDGISRMYFEALAKKYRFSLQTPVRQLSPEVRDVIFYGTRGEKLELHYDQPRGRGTLYQPFEGIANNLERRYQETQSDASKRELEEFMTQCPCPACKGRRLRPEALAVTVGGLSIFEATELPVDEALPFFNGLELTGNQQLIAAQILKEIRARLGFLQSVGLSYLTLSRASGTLSGGESQRIRLATQIGSSLMGVLYILDEPSIGLHQRDNDKLLATLCRLRDLGNTLIVVEHDEDTMYASDFIVEELFQLNTLTLGIPDGHPLAQCERITQDMFPLLHDETFFFSCAQQDTPLSDRQRNQIYQLLGFKNDMKVRFVDFNEPTIALKLVESGAGLLPQACAVPRRIGTVNSVPVENDTIRTGLYYIQRRNISCPALRKLRKCVHEFVGKYN